MEFTKEYFAEKQRERRARDILIYKFHAWEKMPGESDKDFRHRFTKRLVIITESNTRITIGSNGEVIEVKEISNTS